MSADVTKATKSNNIREIYRNVRILADKCRNNAAPLVGNSNSHIDKMKQWAIHFENLLNNKQILENRKRKKNKTATKDLRISVDKFTMNELEVAIKQF